MENHELCYSPIVRNFRFVLSSEHLDGQFNLYVHDNYTKKELIIGAYEIITNEDIPIHNWANAMESGEYPNETLILITFDGCGNELYRRVYKELFIKERKTNFDYRSNDVTIHEVSVNYKYGHNELNRTPAKSAENQCETSDRIIH